MDTFYTIFHFIIAIGVLISIHEFGHFWVARKVGVKVLKFSVGFGKTIWSYQKTKESTEYILAAIPLGGYVKMVDEREAEVKTEDLPFAFNRQSVLARSAIVAAGPVFNLLLAIILYWAVFIIGETGMRPIVGTIESGTLAADAGFIEGEEILSVNGDNAPTWSEAMSLMFSSAIQGGQEIRVTVKNLDEVEKDRYLIISDEDANRPKELYKKLGLKPWTPKLKAVIGKVIEQSPAESSGLQTSDLIISADNQPISDWMQWVEYVRSRPEVVIELKVEREGVVIPLTIMPEKIEDDTKVFGRIGASVEVPEELLNSLRVEYSLSPVNALIAAVERTWFFSATTLKMMGKMIIGEASPKNLSGPISIAKYAGQSAEMGLVHFFKFLAIVSISLGVLNLLPVPILDGGHLMFFAVEAIKGSPVSEKVQMIFQQFGILILLSLMVFAIFLDIERLFQ
ncbi:MAG: RIP metalloprotease RseP [Methylococcales bacterium]|nr:RIP metalloprotease RseP [Methylococcales bacterium]